MVCRLSTFTAYVHILFNSYKNRPTLNEHLWTIKTLLLMKDSSSEPNLLLRYIITACFPKMNQRFKNKPLSEPYFESLRSVNMDQIVFHESKPKLSPSDSEFFLDYLPLVLSAGVTTKVPNILRQVDLIKELAPHLVKQREYIPL